MLADERPSLDGAHYTVRDAINQPPPVGKVPIMIGGSGEKKTLRMVAQYADESNLTCSLDEVPRKLDALAGHCERLGRDRSEVTVSLQGVCVIAPTYDEAFTQAKGFLSSRGIDFDSADDDTQQMLLAMVQMGGPDEMGEYFEKVKGAGIDGMTLSLPANGTDPEAIELLGRTASAVFA